MSRESSLFFLIFSFIGKFVRRLATFLTEVVCCKQIVMIVKKVIQKERDEKRLIIMEVEKENIDGDERRLIKNVYGDEMRLI